ncbi:MAG TPA: hypothetical protein VNU68_15555 [Verrucomicrobiae bacterium]|nr:hypothetical protein [Verrucomicrobiae bacterium]
MSPSEVDYPGPETVQRSLAVQVWDEEAFEVPVKRLDPACERLEDPWTQDPWTLIGVGAADDPDRFRIEAEARDENEDVIEMYI